MEFHLIRNGKQEGPFTVEELGQQGITPESEVWAPGMADWQQAGDVPELTAVLQRAEFEASQQAAREAASQITTGQPYDPTVPPSQVPPRVPRYGQVPEEPKKNGCTPWLIAALILAILFATMVFTCPKPEDHEKAIQEVTKAWVDDKVDDKLGSITGVGGVFGDLINKALKELTGFGTDKVISSYLDVKNYLVCSVGRMSIGDSEEKMVSLGMFGHVFTFGKEDIEKAWTHAMDSRMRIMTLKTRRRKWRPIPGCCPTVSWVSRFPMAWTAWPTRWPTKPSAWPRSGPSSKSTTWASKSLVNL